MAKSDIPGMKIDFERMLRDLVPGYTVYGGSGTGVTLSLGVSGGALATIADPGSGYQPGDVVQVAFSGGGANAVHGPSIRRE